MTPVLECQNLLTASFLKCIQTRGAKTCPATSYWTWTMTQRAPPYEERPLPLVGGAGRLTLTSADQ